MSPYNYPFFGAHQAAQTIVILEEREETHDKTMSAKKHQETQE